MCAGIVIVPAIGGSRGVADEAGLKFLYVRLREIVENPSATDDMPMVARCRAKDRLALPP